MAEIIKTLSIEGFKSIRKLEKLELGAVNVLIGPNGAGKSNFISFFRFLRDIIDERLQVAVQRGGGADAFLYMGPKITKSISMATRFGENGYDFTLVPTVDGRLIFEVEETFNRTRHENWNGYADSHHLVGSGNYEAQLPKFRQTHGRDKQFSVPHYVYESVSSWTVYHFHDTSESSSVRRFGNIYDNETLRSDASNLAAFLYRLQESQAEVYDRIVSVVRLVAPFFGEFKLRPSTLDPDRIQLEWLQRHSDASFLPSQLSDGTLRFICLATALLQPSPPSTLLFDEPELGLHPLALVLLAGLLRGATQGAGFPSNQVIVSTQSAQLLNEFTADEVIVVERADGQSVFTRQSSEQLSVWLENYSLGELWQKNILGGRPRGESDRSQEFGAN